MTCGKAWIRSDKGRTKQKYQEEKASLWLVRNLEGFVLHWLSLLEFSCIICSVKEYISLLLNYTLLTCEYL